MTYRSNNSITAKHLYMVLILLLALNYLDAGFTIYVMEKYSLPEMNPMVAKSMETGLFIGLKIGLVTAIGIITARAIPTIAPSNRTLPFIILTIGLLFYIAVNTVNILFVWRNFGGI